MATIRDVAKHAGVAISTVSFTLNESAPVSEATRRRVMEAVEAVGYTPNVLAQSLKRGHSKVIGLVLGDMTNPFFAQMQDYISSAMNDADHLLIVAQSAAELTREIAVLKQLRRHRVAGIITAPLNSCPEFGALLNEFDTPILLLDQNVEGARLDFVASDHLLATVMLTEYLLRLGHTRIGYIGGRMKFSAAGLRLQGYRQALSRSGTKHDPTLETVADFSAEKAYDQTARLLSRADRPTALVVASNMMALGALQAINDLHFSCPDDVSLTGVDDVPWAEVIKPRITTVAQPVKELADVAAARILDRIAAQAEGTTIAPRTHIAVPRLIIGGSCAPPRN